MSTGIEEGGPIRDRKVHEVEAERLPLDDEPSGSSANAKSDPFLGAYGPILAGLVIDFADFITPLNMGSKIGIPVGGLAGWWIAKRMGLPLEKRIMFAAVGAAYCSLSNTSKLPLGTVLGIATRVMNGRTSRPNDS